MKERPIIFSTPMVRAILQGRKTVTRRVVKPQPSAGAHWQPIVLAGYGGWVDGHGSPLRCPYGQPGDRLWVRETYCIGRVTGFAYYRADGDGDRKAVNGGPLDNFADRWRPSIFMPRTASRITLEVTSVRVERLQDITHEQAIAEGVHVVHIGSGYLDRYSATPVAWSDVVEGAAAAYEDARLAFRDLWDGINAARGFGWAANPMVWVVEFKRIEATA